MVPVHDGTLDRGRLDHVLRHMGWPKVGTARLGSKLSLDIDAWEVLAMRGAETDGILTLFKKDTLEKRVLVA